MTGLRIGPGADKRLSWRKKGEDLVGLLVMIVGLVLFFGAHTLTTQRDLRARFVAAMGESGYKIGYAVVSSAGRALSIWGFSHYRASGSIEVGSTPTALKHLNTALM